MAHFIVTRRKQHEIAQVNKNTCISF
jgi:hypothetical protein